MENLFVCEIAATVNSHHGNVSVDELNVDFYLFGFERELVLGGELTPTGLWGDGEGDHVVLVVQLDELRLLRHHEVAVQV